MSTDTPSTPAAPGPFAQPLDIRRILTTPPPKLDHVLPGLLAGTVGMLAGPGGVGKTMLELQLALAVASGTPICGGLFDDDDGMAPRSPGRVVLVTAEESTAVLWHRLHAIVSTLFGARQRFGIGLAPNALLDLWERNLVLFPLAGAQRVTLVNREHQSTPVNNLLRKVSEGARLVMLDPLRQFHDCDENDSAAMNAVVRITHGLAASTQAAVVFAHHTNRASGQLGMGDTAAAARGSSALTDGVRWQCNLSKPGKDAAKLHGIGEAERGRFLLVDIAKANYLPPQPTAVVERLTGGVLARVRHAAGEPAKPSRRMAPARLEGLA